MVSLSEPISALKCENELFFPLHGSSVMSRVQEELVVLNVVSTFWVWPLYFATLYLLKT